MTAKRRPSIHFTTGARAALALAEDALAEARDPGDHDGVIIDPDARELDRLVPRLHHLAKGLVREHLWVEAWADIERFVTLSKIERAAFRDAVIELDRLESDLLERLGEALERMAHATADRMVQIGSLPPSPRPMIDLGDAMRTIAGE